MQRYTYCEEGTYLISLIMSKGFIKIYDQVLGYKKIQPRLSYIWKLLFIPFFSIIHNELWFLLFFCLILVLYAKKTHSEAIWKLFMQGDMSVEPHIKGWTVHEKMYVCMSIFYVHPHPCSVLGLPNIISIQI